MDRFEVEVLFDRLIDLKLRWCLMGSIIGLYWRKSEKFLFCFRLFKRQNQSKYGKIGSVSPLSQRWDMFVFVYLLPRRGRGIGEGGLMIFCSGWILYLFSDRETSS